MTKTTKRRLTFLVILMAVFAGAVFAVLRIQDARKANELVRTRDAGLEAFEAGDYREAVRNLSKVVRTNSSDYKATLAFAKARLEVPTENNGHIGTALKLAQIATVLEPEEIEPKEMLLELYRSRGFVSEAIDVADDILEIDPGHKDALATLPRAYATLNRDAEALLAAERFVEAYPDDLQAQRLHVGLLLRLNRSEEQIIAKLQEMEATVGDSPGASIVRIGALMELGRVEEAAEILARTIEQAPLEPEVVAQIMTIAGVLERENPELIRDAEAHLADAVRKVDADSALVTVAFARAWQSQENDLILQILSERLGEIGSMPTLALGYALLASMEEGESALASALRHELEKHNATTANDWLAVADAASSPSRESVTQAIATDAANRAMAFLRGRFYRSIGEQELAEFEWTRLGTTPEWARARYALADMMISTDRLREARGVLGSASTQLRSPRHVFLVSEATLRLMERGEGGAQDERFARVVLDVLNESDTLGTTLTSIAGRLAMAVGDDEAAREAGRTLLERGAQDDVGNTLRFAGQLDRIDPEMASALRESLGTSGTPVPSLVLAEVDRLTNSGDRAAARETLEEAIGASSGGDRVALERAFGRFIQVQGNEAEAVRYLRTLAERYPDTPLIQKDYLDFEPSWGEPGPLRGAIDRLKSLAGEESLGWRIYEARLLLTGNTDQEVASSVVLSLSKVLQSDPDHTRALIMMSEAYRQLDNSARAVSFLERAIEGSTNRPTVYVILINELLSIGRFEQARDRLVEFSSIEPVTLAIRRQRAAMLEDQSFMDEALADRRVLSAEGTVGDRVALARLQLNMGRRSDAVATIASVDLGAPLDTLERLALANTFEALGEPDNADEVLQGIPSESEFGAKDLVVGRFYLGAGRTDEASTLLERYASSISTADAWVEVATSYRATGAYELALDAVARAKEIDPSNEAASEIESTINAIAGVSEGGGSLAGQVVFTGGKRAIESIVRILAGDDRSEAARSLLSITSRYAESEIDEAGFLASLDALAREHTRHYPTWRLLLHTQAKSGASADALVTVQTMVQSFPTDPRPARLATALLASESRFEEAYTMARTWRSRTLADPEQADFAIALFAMEIGDHRAAMSQLERWASEISANPSSNPAYTSIYARALASSGSLREAHELVWPLVESDDVPMPSYLQLLQAGTGNVAELTRILDIISPLASSDEGVGIAIAQIWYQIGIREGSADALRSALRYAGPVFESAQDDPTRFFAARVLAGANQFLGNTAEAIRFYRVAIDLDGDHPDMLNNLAYLNLENGGEAQESIDLAVRAVQLNQARGEAFDALKEYYDTLGIAYNRGGQHERAETTFRAALDLAPNDIGLTVGLAEALAGQERLDEARELLARIGSRGNGGPFDSRISSLRTRLGV